MEERDREKERKRGSEREREGARKRKREDEEMRIRGHLFQVVSPKKTRKKILKKWLTSTISCNRNFSQFTSYTQIFS